MSESLVAPGPGQGGEAAGLVSETDEGRVFAAPAIYPGRLLPPAAQARTGALPQVASSSSAW